MPSLKRQSPLTRKQPLRCKPKRLTAPERLRREKVRSLGCQLCKAREQPHPRPYCYVSIHHVQQGTYRDEARIIGLCHRHPGTAAPDCHTTEVGSHGRAYAPFEEWALANVAFELGEGPDPGPPVLP